MGRLKFWLSNTWNNVKKPLMWSGIIIGILVIILILTYRVPGSGFGQYTITKIDPSTNRPIEIETHSRTLWDWMELLVIPGLLALIAFLFNKAEKNRDRTRELERQREDALRNLFDQIEKFVSNGSLVNCSSKQIQEIMRARIFSTF